MCHGLETAISTKRVFILASCDCAHTDSITFIVIIMICSEKESNNSEYVCALAVNAVRGHLEAKAQASFDGSVTD